ncbi:MAG: hypothetical protein ABIP79_16755 [Chitinophagaceae bacterium]
MIASTDNKFTSLRIAWQQETPPLKIFPPRRQANKTGKQVDKAINADSSFQKCKMPEQPKGYIKAPRYEFF